MWKHCYLVESQVLDEDVLLALNAVLRGWSGTQSQGLSYSIGFTDVRNASRLFIVALGVDLTAVVVDDVDTIAVGDGVVVSGAGNEATRSACGVNLSGTEGKGWFSGTGGSGLLDNPDLGDSMDRGWSWN